jgi:hypothetical protein
MLPELGVANAWATHAADAVLVPPQTDFRVEVASVVAPSQHVALL